MFLKEHTLHNCMYNAASLAVATSWPGFAGAEDPNSSEGADAAL